MTALTLRWHGEPLAVVMAEHDAEPASRGPIHGSLTTHAGTTLVVAYSDAEHHTRAEGPFRAVEVQGPLDFSLTGILAGLLIPLAEKEISVFTLSTFDTDWVLVPAGDVERATEALAAAGHRFEEAP